MNTLIVVIICLSFNVLIFFYFKWFIKRRTSTSGILPEYQKEVERLIADIDDATDRDSLLVEDRIRKLKEILNETDRRTEVYLRELDKRRSGELYSNLGRGIRAALKEEVTPVEDAQTAKISAKPSANIAQAYQLMQTFPASTLLSAVQPDAIEINPQLQAHSQPAKPEPAASVPPVKYSPPEPVAAKPPSKRQIRLYIDNLLNEGVAPEEIASTLGISIAEVNLAVNLSKRRSAGKT